MSSLIDDLKTAYLSWLRERIQLRELDGAIEITSPLTDRHNDYLQLYLTQHGSKLRLTDAGYILGDLELDGIDVLATPKRRQLFESVLNRYGVMLSSDKEIYTEATLDTFPQKKHMLLQAMVTINDMFLTSRTNVSGLFFEEVAQFFQENDVRSVPNIAFVGKTGFTHQFDFIIPGTRVHPERVVKSLNSVDKQKTSLLLFAWNDMKAVRTVDSKLFVFVNDQMRKVSANALQALEHYDVKTILWSRRQAVLEELTA